MAGEHVGLPIPRALVEFVLLGPANDQRQLQDSPILGDVWVAYADKPAKPQDLLMTPHMEETAGRVAKFVAERLAKAGKPRNDRKDAANVAYLQGIVAARLFFEEVLRIIVPITLWWQERKIPAKLEIYSPRNDKGRKTSRNLRSSILKIFKSFPVRVMPGSDAETDLLDFNPFERYIALAGLILWAGDQPRPDGSLTLEEILNKITESADEIVEKALNACQGIGDILPEEGKKLIFYVSLNRRTMLAVEKSVPAVKADAASHLFKVKCEKITWAVLDVGIDRDHDAFKNDKDETRIRKTFDFTRIRDIVSREKPDEARLERLSKGTKLTKRKARSYLNQLAKDARDEHPLNWSLVEKFVYLETPPPPASLHGTHVAGILGAQNVDGTNYAVGMCPDIQIYDFRVLARNLDETEFAVIAALQYIRYLNELHNFITVHGANLSLSIPHDVRNYACGRTPLCIECERLVESGVVVVAAAGNRGYQTFDTADGRFESYAAFSITDPGNADSVITVGSTHRSWPHTYGVSFFSSRGPTGDGRLKPDLVAPGERIHAPALNNEWGRESGTSMAAPHVSGAAAMLMARYPELVGQPRRIKRILCDSATDLGRERSFQGHGMLDVLRAFQSL
jgi:serine protease AprX